MGGLVNPIARKSATELDRRRIEATIDEATVDAHDAGFLEADGLWSRVTTRVCNCLKRESFDLLGRQRETDGSEPLPKRDERFFIRESNDLHELGDEFELLLREPFAVDLCHLAYPFESDRAHASAFTIERPHGVQPLVIIYKFRLQRGTLGREWRNASILGRFGEGDLRRGGPVRGVNERTPSIASSNIPLPPRERELFDLLRRQLKTDRTEPLPKCGNISSFPSRRSSANLATSSSCSFREGLEI
jgi:hypothetical protein